MVCTAAAAVSACHAICGAFGLTKGEALVNHEPLKPCLAAYPFMTVPSVSGAAGRERSKASSGWSSQI